MKDKIITIIIKTFSDVIAVLIIFSMLNNPIIEYLKNIGLTDSKAQLTILSTISVCISSIILIFLEVILFCIIFKPINIEISFLNSKDKIIKCEKLKTDDKNLMNIKANFKLNIKIYGGNKITNSLLNIIGSDVVVLYRPKAYDTEISNGWINVSSQNLYKDKKEQVRYYWTDSLIGQDSISEENLVELRPELIIQPKRFDVHKCQLYIKISSSKKKNFICRFLYSICKLFLVSVKIKPFEIINN